MGYNVNIPATDLKAMKLRKGMTVEIEYSRDTTGNDIKIVTAEIIQIKYKKVLKTELWINATNQYGKLDYTPQAQNEDDYMYTYEVITNKDVYQAYRIYGIKKS